jgi:hypothetical protein
MVLEENSITTLKELMILETFGVTGGRNFLLFGKGFTQILKVQE